MQSPHVPRAAFPKAEFQATFVTLEGERTGRRDQVAGHEQQVKLLRVELDPALPREVIRYELPEHERVNACPCCRAADRAPGLAKDLLTENALAWVISAKYQDALPLYRQAALLGRFGGRCFRA